MRSVLASLRRSPAIAKDLPDAPANLPTDNHVCSSLLRHMHWLRHMRRNAIIDFQGVRNSDQMIIWRQSPHRCLGRGLHSGCGGGLPLTASSGNGTNCAFPCLEPSYGNKCLENKTEHAMRAYALSTAFCPDLEMKPKRL